MADQGSIQLILIRTGATDWDDAGRLQGLTDLPLSTPGKEALNQHLSEFRSANPDIENPSSVLHATDEASRQSGALAARVLGGRSRDLEPLHDVGLGLWEGLLEDELLERHPSAHRQWREDPSMATPPEGEPVLDAEARLLDALSRATAKGSKRPIAVVLRPTAFALIRSWLTGQPVSRLWETLEMAPPVDVLHIHRSRLLARREREGSRA